MPKEKITKRRPNLTLKKLTKSEVWKMIVPDQKVTADEQNRKCTVLPK